MFDQGKADQAINFIENLKHTKDPWRGVNFELLDWQHEIMSDVFGTIKKDGYRRFNTAYVEIPKKNGKSELAAGVGLYLTCGDGEWGAEVYGAAVDRLNASIVFDVAVDMVDQCPALKKRIKLVLSQKRMIYLPTKSFYQVLSSEAFSKHGFNAHGVVFDELHAQPNRGLFDVLTKGAGDARMQNLNFVISTAGDDPDRKSIGWEVHQKAMDVLNGIKKIPNFYAKVYGVGEDEDWEDEANWIKANPSVGHNLRIEKFREWYDDCKGNPAEERLFQQLRLNQWVKTKASKWIGLDKWDASAGMVIKEELKGRDCYGGLDLALTTDLAAFALIFPPIGEETCYDVLMKFYIPEDNMQERSNKDRVDYDTWVKEKYIQSTPGDVIDYDFIKRDILRARDMYNILEIGFDRFHATQIALQLSEEDLTMVDVRQNAKFMSAPMIEVGNMIKKSILRHGGNPVLRWNFSNLEVKIDADEMIKPIKGKDTNRIDGFVAIIIAAARMIVAEEEHLPGIAFS